MIELADQLVNGWEPARERTVERNMRLANDLASGLERVPATCRDRSSVQQTMTSERFAGRGSARKLAVTRSSWRDICLAQHLFLQEKEEEEEA